MTDWQIKLETVLARDLYILQHAMFTDCVFIVGDEKKEFKVHRLMLAKTSPVMVPMLYGEMFREGEAIRVPDISPQIFEAMLKYMYEGKVQLDSFEMATGLLYAAKKYLLPDSLVRQCRATIRNLMYPDNVWATLQFASCNDEPELEDEAWKILRICFEELIIHPDFQQAAQSVVVALVQQDQLMMHSEFQLYEQVLGWARSQVQMRGEVEDPAVLREVLAPVLPHIRFLTMTTKQLARGPIFSGILSEAQGFRLLMKVADPELELEMPEGFCSEKTPRCWLSSNSEMFQAIKSSYDELPTEETWSSYKFNPYAGGIGGIAGCCVLFGVQLPTQIKLPGCTSDTYDEDLTVLLYDIEDMIIFTATRFTGNARYDSVIDVPFEEEIDLEDIYRNLELRVVFHTTGYYPHKYKNNDVPEPSEFGPDFVNAKYIDRSESFKFIYRIVYFE